MRLKQINIINFGQLSNLTFNLPSDEINVFFGENEAGKSTTVAFIKQVIFGFYLRSNSSPFFEDYKPLAHVSPMGGSLIFEDEQQQEYKLERLWAKGDKTKKGILTVTHNGEQVPETLFFDKIKNIDGNFYADSFIFNQEMLGQVISLSQADLLERIYYLGAANSSQLLNLRDSFNKEAGQLFKKTGKKPEVNRLLSQIDDERASLKDTQSEFTEYEKLRQELKEQTEELNAEEKKLKKLQTYLQHMQEIQTELGSYMQLQQLQGKASKVQFTAENYRQAQELTAQIKNLQASIASLKQELMQISANDSFDLETAKKLVQKKTEVLQWQSEYKTCVQKAEEIKTTEKQLLQLNPELATVLKLSDPQISQLQKDFTSLPQKPTVPNISNNSSNKLWLIAGAVLIILGLTQVMSNGLIGAIGFILGIMTFVYGFWSQKQASKKIALTEQIFQQKESAFKEEYGLNPENLDLKSLLTNRNNYLLKVEAEKNNNQNLAEIKDQVAVLLDQLKQLLKKPISANFANILTALDQLQEKLDRYQSKNERHHSLQMQLTQQTQKLNDLNLKLKAILAKDNVNKMSEYDERYQASLNQVKLQTQISTLQEKLTAHLNELKQVDRNKLESRLLAIQKEISDQEKIVAEKQQKAAETKVQLSNLADSTAVFSAKQNLANSETDFLNSSKEYLANLLAAKWIDRSLDIASNERFPKMLVSAKEYLNLLTGGRYTDLTLDKKITVTRFDGKKREVKYLSRATAEQLYFALKLAFVEQIKDQINLPILIDDSFVNFDDRRIGYIEKLLKKISENNQVLIFTAQDKLAQKLSAKPLTFRKDRADA